MKKFQFSLERILRYHQQRLKQAEMHVAQAAMERDSARLDVDRCQQRIDDACQLNETVGGPINPTIRANVTAHLEQLAEILSIAGKRLMVAEERFREIDRVRTEISRDAEGLSLLRDQRRVEHRVEVAWQQQIDLDEIVMRKWTSRDDDDPPITPGFPE